MSIGGRIFELRKEQNMTLARAAEKVGVALSGYQSWEIDRTIPNAVNLAKIADAYDVSVDWLLGRTTNRETNL